MIIEKYGDIFDSKAEAIINTINCVGVMGSGIALEFKNKYPVMFEKYKELCKEKQIKIGTLYNYDVPKPTDELPYKIIINFPTKDNWKDDSRLEYIKFGLKTLTKFINSNKIKSIIIPPLGCGKGNLNWDIVKPMILEFVNRWPNDIEVILYNKS